MAASVRVCCALRIQLGGGLIALRTAGGALPLTHLARSTAYQWPYNTPSFAAPTSWIQIRHGSFFNKRKYSFPPTPELT
ncbi:hypothetical protein DPEC_G00370950 [Dallia pectoralis]|nr:hypothetical protein DPEC_G00370950 [Dallia pectoralis]